MRDTTDLKIKNQSSSSVIKHPQKFNKDVLDITLVYDQYFKKKSQQGMYQKTTILLFIM